MRTVAKTVKKALNESDNVLNEDDEDRKAELISEILAIVEEEGGECDFYYTLQGGLDGSFDIDCTADEEGILVYVDPDYPEKFTYDELSIEDLEYYLDNMAIE